MGIIRTLLALAVVLYHSYGIMESKEYMTGGMVSVEAFYIISGFYMAMILNEKYRKGSYRLFISNRFLRIYPVYWACLILVLVICLAGKAFWNQPFYLWYWTSQWSHFSWTTIAILLFSNIFLFGSDWLMFTGVNAGTGKLELVRDPYYYNPMTGQYFFIPQIWTVGLELTFYLAAPLLVRMKWFLQLGVVIASLALRYYLYHHKGLDFDPWTYRFFPSELALFMAGSLAYKASLFLREKRSCKTAGGILWLLVVALIAGYPHLGFLSEPQRSWYFYAVFAAALPFIFIFSRSFKADRIIGELSFPVYVCHHFVMFLWRQYFWEHTEYMHWFGIVTALSTLAVAFLLWRFVIVPVEKVRQRRVERKSVVLA